MAFVCAMSLFACTRNYDIDYNYNGTQQVSDNDNDSNDNGGKSSDSGNSQYAGKVLSIEEAQAVSIGSEITVEGYIVGSCTKSMNNADFTAPFEGSTAIILASEPLDLDNGVPETSSNTLFPVCISDYDEIRYALNLEDNPNLWNKHIIVTGTRAKYMARAGLKPIFQFSFD